MKILVGIVTFGNTEFTRLTVNSIRETSSFPVDFFIVVGKPGDSKTLNWLSTEPDIKFKVHTENMGFPYSINDIYDYAWKENSYDYLILAGNDIVAYPYAIDSLIKLADISDYECINALQYDVRDLVRNYPDTRHYFKGDKQLFHSFDDRPWEEFKDYSPVLSISHMQLLDIQNLCLYKKSCFEKVGYTDVSFYPAYFVDNDYARRMVNTNVKCCVLYNARFFHFWSRTIHQGQGGSTSHHFRNNEQYYKEKWGGEFGQETLSPELNIQTRDGEETRVAYWRNR